MRIIFQFYAVRKIGRGGVAYVMSQFRNINIILPATGGGILLTGLFFNKFFLVISGILLGMVIWKVISNLIGERERHKSKM